MDKDNSSLYKNPRSCFFLDCNCNFSDTVKGSMKVFCDETSRKVVNYRKLYINE